jgi:hypothetical protein
MTGPKLDPEASKALGSVSPQRAWRELLDVLARALENQPEESEALAQQMNLPGDLDDLLAILGQMDPVEGINQLHYASQNLDLQNLPKQTPLSILQAVLSMVLESDRWQGMAV